MGEFFFETKNNNFWKDCSSKHKIWRPKKWGYFVSIIQANPTILLILSQFLSFPSVSACALKTKNIVDFHFSTKIEAFFFPLRWSPQFKIHRHWTKAHKVDWERMSRSIRSAWKWKKKHTSILKKKFPEAKKKTPKSNKREHLPYWVFRIMLQMRANGSAFVIL